MKTSVRLVARLAVRFETLIATAWPEGGPNLTIRRVLAE
jgi:hypothetical protein